MTSRLFILFVTALVMTARGPAQSFSTLQKFDQGFSSSSAIGQLSELTGQSIRVPRVSGTRMIGGGTGGGNLGLSNAMNGVGMMVGTMILTELLSSALSGSDAAAAAAASGPSPAELALARAQAQAEAAARLRQDWDRRDAELSAQLDGVFEVKHSTNAFGIRSNADDAFVREALKDIREPLAYEPVDLTLPEPSATGSADTVDLSDATTGVVRFLRAPTVSAQRASVVSGGYTTSRMDAAPDVVAPRRIELGENAEWAANYIGEQVVAIGYAGLWEFAHGLPGYRIAKRASAIYEKIDAVREVLEHPLVHATLGLAEGGMSDAQAAANFLGTGSGAAPDGFEERATNYQRLIRDEIRDEVAGRVSPGQDDYESVLREPELGKSDVVPLNKYVHPDFARMRSILRL